MAKDINKIHDYKKIKEQKDLTFNGMSATEWAKHSKSVYKDIPPMKENEHFDEMKIIPLELIDRLINIYSKEEDKLLDPFMGSGTSIISGIRNNRFCYGFEINEKYFKYAENNIMSSLNLLVNGEYRIFNEDCLEGLKRLNDDEIQLTLSSLSLPIHKRKKKYEYDLRVFDNLTYEEYLSRLENVLSEVYRVTKKNGYVALIVEDYRNVKDNIPYVEFHSDVAKVGQKVGFLYQDVIIYDHNDQRGLLLQGYPNIFYANLNHDYIVILRKAK